MVAHLLIPDILPKKAIIKQLSKVKGIIYINQYNYSILFHVY